VLDVLCVLKSGGDYDADWVRKLQDSVKRNLNVRHRFRCLSDVEVPCERIPLKHNWPGWWSKIELFRPDVVEGPTIYFDLDVVITGSLDEMSCIPCDFAMLRNFWTEDDMVNSSVMWFSGDNVPTGIYSKFAKQADAYITHYNRHADGAYVGDQAFVWDTLAHNVDYVNSYFDGIYSYKLHCKSGLPKNTSIACFHGHPRPSEVKHDWVENHWR
jgi:hypothetical protein